MTLTPEQARALVESVCRACNDDTECTDCANRLAAFAQAELAGKPLDEALVAVRAHLANCRECCEEYEALCLALEALTE